MDRSTESIGFVARWFLLAVAAGIVAVTALMVASAGMKAVGADEPTGGVFADVIWVADTPVYMEARGQLIPPLKPGQEQAVICSLAGGEPWLSRMNDQGVLVQVGQVANGRHAVRIAGLPHSRQTFVASELTLSAPRDRRVALISAKDILSSWRTKGGETQVARIVDELRRSSTIVWLCGGDAEAFAQQRQWARRIDDESILVYLGPQWPIDWNALRVFHRQSGLRDAAVPIVLLTWEESLAIMADKLGVQSHLISTRGPSEPLPQSIRCYRTLEKFKESLGEPPISD